MFNLLLISALIGTTLGVGLYVVENHVLPRLKKK